MLDEIDTFDFVLAERLGGTVEDLLDKISNREYLAWRALYVYRQAMAEFDKPG